MPQTENTHVVFAVVKSTELERVCSVLKKSIVAATTYSGLLIIQPVFILKRASLEILFTEMEEGFIFTEEIWIKRVLKN